MEKKFEVPEHCKSFTVITLENGDFEVVYEIEHRRRVLGSYYFINSECEIDIECDSEDLVDDDRFELGNYFITEELAKEALVYIKNAFNEFWKTKNSSD